MTLDIRKLIKNRIEKERVIHHWEGRCEIFRRDEIPEAVAARIQEIHGEDYLEDANYVLFFSAPGLNKAAIKKYVFKITNKALGESANSMTPGDFKILSLNGRPAAPADTSADTPADTQADTPAVSDPEADAENAIAVADVIAGDGEGGQEDPDDFDPVTQDEIDRVTGDYGDSDEDSEDGDSDEDSDEDSGEGDSEDGSDDSEEDEGSEGEDEDDEDDLDESVSEPEAGERFCFLKITTK